MSTIKRSGETVTQNSDGSPTILSSIPGPTSSQELTFKDTIPFFYRKFFLIVDPTIAVWGVYMNLTTPERVIDAFVPKELSPYNPLQGFLLHQISGALLLCVFLDVFLLRRTSEVWIWKTQQMGQLVYDAAILYGMYDALGQQGRLDLGTWRIEDWGSLGITGGCGLVRALFCLGVGFGAVRRRKMV